MRELMTEFCTFLDGVLPDDYQDRYDHYRHDRDLRSLYQAAAFDEGWLVPEWEVGLGGRGVSAADALSLRLEGARRQVPRLMNVQGAGVAAPALRQFGTPEQRDRLLRPVLRGDEWWALGMSEPGAGSDLASLRTTAELVDGTFVVNGQKVWTTQADESRWCTLYVRTDPTVSPHRGISCLILDLESTGVDVRPIRTADPAVESFCEVFLDDVRVPESSLLGPLNGGWSVAMSSLEHERDMIWINNWMETRRALAPIGLLDELDPTRAADMGRLEADAEALRFTGLRSAARSRAGLSTPEFAILKLFGSESVQRAAALTADLDPDNGLFDVSLFAEQMDSLSASIYGGTSQIQRNIIAERVLGLPKGR